MDKYTQLVNKILAHNIKSENSYIEIMERLIKPEGPYYAVYDVDDWDGPYDTVEQAERMHPEADIVAQAEFDEVVGDQDYEPYEMSDVEADADTLASAGMGTDEDYGYFGDYEDEEKIRALDGFNIEADDEEEILSDDDLKTLEVASKLSTAGQGNKFMGPQAAINKAYGNMLNNVARKISAVAAKTK